MRAAGTVAPRAALIAAGAAAGAASMAMNEAFNTHFTCLACLAKPALKGAVVGALAAAPFLAVPAGLTGAAAVAALAGAGGASGAIGYVGNWYADGAHPDQWSWTGLGLSVLGGAVLGPLGGKIGGSGGSPGMRLAVPRFELPQLFPEPALAGVPSGALAGAGVPASQGVVVGAVSAQGARAVGTAVQSGAGATGMAMSASGGGGGNGGDSGSGTSSSGDGQDPNPASAPATKQYPDGSVRTSDGKFAGKTGVVPGTPGVDQAEAAVNARPGWRVVGREISVRDADGTLRRYDLVAKDPNGEYVGIEVKSGTASRDAQQRRVDANLGTAGGLDAVGKRAANAGVDRITSVEQIRVP